MVVYGVELPARGINHNLFDEYCRDFPTEQLCTMGTLFHLHRGPKEQFVVRGLASRSLLIAIA